MKRTLKIKTNENKNVLAEPNLSETSDESMEMKE